MRFHRRVIRSARRYPPRLSRPGHPVVELEVRVIRREHELRDEDPKSPPPCVAIAISVQPPGERVELGEIREPVPERSAGQVGLPERKRIVSVEVHARPTAVGQAHRLDEIERNHLPARPRVPADNDVAPVLPLQSGVGGVEHARIEARASLLPPAQVTASGLHERLEAARLGRLAPDHPVVNARVAPCGRNRKIGHVPGPPGRPVAPRGRRSPRPALG